MDSIVRGLHEKHGVVTWHFGTITSLNFI